MRLPYAAVRGEDLELIVAVFNYVEGSGSLTVQVQVTLSPEVELLEGQNDTSVSVLEGEATRVSLRVRPKAVGSWTIRADAVAGAKGDAMVKKLLVKPEGIPMSDTKSIVVDLTGTDAFSETKTLSLPEMAVPDSARLAVSVVGDLLGPTISGLERLLRIPTGCGEQNMITLAPNVFVAKYLLAVGKMTPDLRERIVNNMVVGYGRELTYRHEDGSFSAFGKSDSSGSTWLTAFVLRVFAEVHQTGLVAVDTGVMTKAAEFLLAQQQSDGSFKSVGKVIHQEMMGGASGSSAVPLTAYVTAALAKAKDVASVAGGLQKAANFLEQVSATTTYTALLRAHALVLAGLWSDEQVATEVLALSSTALPRRFWSGSTGVSDPAPGAYGVKTMDVEMTGYGVLALTMANRLTEAFQGASWLLERRSASGGFSSTQDTVVALNALATYAATVGQNVDLTLEVSNGGSFQQTLQITSGNADVLQTLALPVAAGELPVVVESSGNGVALVTAELQYNLPDSAVPPCYQIEVDWFSQDQETSSAVQACSLPVSDCAPSAGAMAIISVGLFTGYGASLQSLQALKDAEVIKRFELNDQRVDLYLEELHESSKTCVQFNITREFRVWNVQPAASMVYEYYKPEARGELLSSFSTQVFTDEVSQLPGIQPSVTTTMPTAASAATAAAFLTTSLLAFAVHAFA
ncbi:unnamed protein product [Effrenium voratum]|nr:unnamed protein product [Effrenium voratum]